MQSLNSVAFDLYKQFHSFIIYCINTPHYLVRNNKSSDDGSGGWWLLQPFSNIALRSIIFSSLSSSSSSSCFHFFQESYVTSHYKRRRGVSQWHIWKQNKYTVHTMILAQCVCTWVWAEIYLYKLHTLAYELDRRFFVFPFIFYGNVYSSCNMRIGCKK